MYGVIILKFTSANNGTGKKKYFFTSCLFDLILYLLSTILQLCRMGLPGLNQY